MTLITGVAHYRKNILPGGALSLDDLPGSVDSLYMGLDTVEIVMATEAAFNIKISDGEAETIVTPRQLIEFVMTKIAAAETGVCVTQRAFHLLRRSFVSHQLLTRQQIRPGTELALAFPRQQRAEQLRQLSSELAVDPFPPLVRAGWLKAMLAGLSLTTGLAVAVALSQSPFSVLPPEIFGPLQGAAHHWRSGALGGDA